jgi:tetratricopeptide (TPR) repeat protein
MEVDPVRIIILIMVKNESKIIKRSIDSTLSFADAICIEDTGSTDDTVEVIKEHYKSITIPTKITQHPWRNFGYSRSHSFISAQNFCKEIGWNPARTYAIAIDADMNLIVSPTFNKDTLTLSGYQLMQINGSLEYVNIRFMRISDSWSCIGATHEYWNMPEGEKIGTIAKEFIYIDDKNDGGCKSDKFTRDLQLLLDEVKEQPENVRTNFYLAQTYKCLDDYDNAIKAYKKRITLGGWFEEVWYSYYMISQLYISKDQPEKAELWVQRGQKYNNYRAESLYNLAKYFRQQPASQWKAMHYLKEAMKISKPSVSLFTEGDIYEYLLDYENTILQCWVNPLRKEGNIASIKYMLKSNPPHLDNVFSNLEFYVEPLPQHYDSLRALHPPKQTYLQTPYPLHIGQTSTPPYFKHLCASANAVLCEDLIYVLTYAIKYATPHKYMYHIVKLDRLSMKPLAISHAFAFDELLIEYCLTMNMRDDVVEFIYSNFDSDPRIKHVPFSEFTFISIN